MPSKVSETCWLAGTCAEEDELELDEELELEDDELPEEDDQPLFLFPISAATCFCVHRFCAWVSTCRMSFPTASLISSSAFISLVHPFQPADLTRLAYYTHALFGLVNLTCRHHPASDRIFASPASF